MTGTSIKFLAVLLFIVLILQVMPSPAPTHPSVRGNGGLQPSTGTPTVAHTPTPTGTPTPIGVSPPVCGWNAVPGPKLSGWMGLQDVAAISPNDIWAVGVYSSPQYASGGETLTLHWDGTGWRRIPSPSPGTGGRLVGLNGIAAIASDDVWAVGSYYESAKERTPQGQRILILHWDGNTWSLVPSPNPDGGGSLNDVAAVSANDVWAVGWYFTNCGRRALILHWDGASWNEVPSPFPYPGDNIELRGIAALAADDIWAVGINSGQTLTIHWDGVRWSVVPSPSVGMSSQLDDVAAVSADDVWAVGYTNWWWGWKMAALILHWDGTGWDSTWLDVQWSAALSGITALAPDDVWAVGRYFSCPFTWGKPLILHWNGSTWSAISTSWSGYLTSITSLSSDNLWAVGENLIAQYASGACVTATPTPTTTLPTPTCTPAATETLPPTPPATPVLLQPADGATLPQPIPPHEWRFVWRSNSGESSWISIRGPGGRCIRGAGVESPQDDYVSQYTFQYTADRLLYDDALGPWYWSVQHTGYIDRRWYSNQSDTRTFWVEPFQVRSRGYLPLILRSSASRSSDR